MRVGERRQDQLTSKKVTEALRIQTKRGFEAAFVDLLRQGVDPSLARAVLIAGRERRSDERRVAVHDGEVRRIVRA
jgi:hypothetical protein